MGSRFTTIYNAVYKHVIEKLKGLSPLLTYHCLEHTLDVLEQAQRIAKEEDIKDDENLFLLQMASLYHDTGFLFVYAGHEAKSCEMANHELPGFGVTGKQIDKICGMIMATKIPQSPTNKLEKIICDADLDYLGRDDFEVISNNLYKEFLEFGFVKDYDDWMKKQIGFFGVHQYFTKSSQQLRHPEKMKHFAQLKLYIPSDNG
jgi:predicted metal-dependent HD superfamily phosphohydrolase